MGIITCLVDYFTPLPAAERAAHLVLLPTKNLVEQLQYRLAASSGATLLPTCWTIGSLSDSYGQHYRRVPTENGRRALIHRLLRQRPYRHFTPGNEGQLLETWDDFIFCGRLRQAAEITTGAFLRQLQQQLQPTLERSAAYRQFLLSYLEEWEQIFTLYLEQLRLLDLDDPRLAERQKLAGTISRLDLIADRYRILVADLYDAPPIQAKLLLGLAARGARFFFSGCRFSRPHHRPALTAAIPPAQTTWCGPKVKKVIQAATARKPVARTGDSAIEARVFSSVAGECRFAIYQALALVCEGLPPAEIAIVLLDQQHYREIFFNLLHALPAGKFNLEIFSYNLKRSLDQAAITVFIDTLIRLAGAVPLSTTLLLETLASPYFASLFLAADPGKEAVDTAGALDAARRLLSGRIINERRQLKMLAGECHRQPAGSVFAALDRASRHFPARTSLNHYLECTTAILDQETGVAGNLYENAAREYLRQEIAALAALDLDLTLSPAGWHSFFRFTLGKGETGLDYNYLDGIQVLDPRDAKGISVKALFLLGNASGTFIGRRRHRLFTPRQQELLGLVTPEEEEVLQRYSFYSLVNNSRRVYLSYSLTAGGQPRDANIFFQELVRAGVPLHPETFQVDWQDEEPASDPPAPNLPAASLPLDIIPPRLSGHLANNLCRCPASYFFAALDLYSPETRESHLDPLGEGNLLHEIGEQLGKKFRGPASEAEILAAIREIAARRETGWEEKLLLSFHEHSGTWNRLARFLSTAGHHCLAVEEEISADLAPLLGLPLQGRGRVDRREATGAGERLVDFKRRRIPTKKELQELTEVQLLFYALLHRQRGKEISEVAYYSFRRQEGKNVIALPVAGNVDRLEELLGRLVQEIRREGYRKEIAAGTCRDCPFQEICLDESQRRFVNGL